MNETIMSLIAGVIVTPWLHRYASRRLAGFFAFAVLAWTLPLLLWTSALELRRMPRSRVMGGCVYSSLALAALAGVLVGKGKKDDALKGGVA